MTALSRHAGTATIASGWQPDVLQMLDEDHLVAWSASSAARLQFAASFTNFLEDLRHVEICVLYGRFITDLDSFCYQLERSIPGKRLDRRVDGGHGVTGLLRTRETFPGKPPARYRYYIWNDAEVLLEHDTRLFGRLVDAMAGVAAEAEYVDDDLLLIHRGVFIGGPELRAYADDPRGQLRSWMPDGGSVPFWQVVTGLESPPVRLLDVDRLLPDDH